MFIFFDDDDEPPRRKLSVRDEIEATVIGWIIGIAILVAIWYLAQRIPAFWF